MTGHQATRSQSIRQGLDHPVIDCDGHLIEYGPLLLDYLEREAGADTVKAWAKYGDELTAASWFRQTPASRAHHRIGRPAWWATPAANTLDRATAQLPALRRERMAAFGIDYAVLFPSAGLGLVNLPNDELRPQLCRAYNTMVADLFSDHADVMTPVALIPTHTPGEAVAALEHGVRECGLKSIMVANFVSRTVPAAQDAAGEIRRAAYYLDSLALDSPYDYDPVWAKCRELKVAPCAHNTSWTLGLRRSTSNFMYNHCGNFAESGELFAKALFFGGVTRRFPDVNFAFLEGGVAWASVLFHGLVSRWNKRNSKKIHGYDQNAVDTTLLRELFAKYGNEQMRNPTVLDGSVGRRTSDHGLSAAESRDPSIIEEFRACGAERAEDLIELFAKPFFFGCEAEEPFAGAAIRGMGMPFGQSINAVFSSDMGHWDVENMDDVLEESWELVEHGLMTEDEYRSFTFANPVRLFAGMNPNFFKGTAVEAAAGKLIGTQRRVAAE